MGSISTIIVKDMSRFGRDCLGVGKYTESVLPSCFQKRSAMRREPSASHLRKNFAKPVSARSIFAAVFMFITPFAFL